MKTYIALFRGINVGGRNVLRMKPLRSLLESLGLQKVRSYIQSGNVVFQSEEGDGGSLAQAIREAVEEKHGFAPRVLVLERAQLQAAVAGNPYPEADEAPRSVHLYFLATAPQNPDLARLEALRKESERFALKDDVFYLHAPEGIGRSKLARKAESLLGVPVTARNWRTVGKIVALAEEVG